ncbi:MAG: fructose bisphosphate aldolase [Spirochaetales bacterium]|nr:fructose bisphosphate aldolase [Spirochaetales bacterium]
MNQKQLEIMKGGKGFIAALDQSGGSTPRALSAYGIEPEAYDSEEKMFELVHEMRSRIVKSPSFTSYKILGAILFEKTMDSRIEGEYTADYLWNKKGIVPFLKIDKGLSDPDEGVQMMKPIPNLDDLLLRAVDRNIFGTKMRSVIREYNLKGIDKIVDQQFELAEKIRKHGLVPIIEPEVDIHSSEKERCEKLLLESLIQKLDQMEGDVPVMLKLTIPSVTDLYLPLINHPKVLRVVALSGGYSREDADRKLSQNHGLIASFSRALSEGLTYQQSDRDFDSLLESSIQSIYNASLT